MSKVSVPFVRSANNYDTMAASNESALECLDPSLAQQSAKDECDINIILKRMASGVHPNFAERQAQYGDFTTSATSYHDALNVVAESNAAFAALPAEVRARFHNNPAELLDFVHDRKNLEEARTLGLVPPLEDLSPAAKREPQALAKAAGGKSAGPGKGAGKVSLADLEGDDGED